MTEESLKKLKIKKMISFWENLFQVSGELFKTSKSQRTTLSKKKKKLPYND